MDVNLVDIFYLVDEPRRARRSQFCKEFEKAKAGHVLQKDCAKKSRNRKFTMSDSEVITIMVCLPLSVNSFPKESIGFDEQIVSLNGEK